VVRADPLMDVAFAAWKWVPLESHAAALGFPEPVDRGRRLRILADAYGLDAGQRARLLDRIEHRMTSMITGIERLAAEGRPAFVRLLAEGHNRVPAPRPGAARGPPGRVAGNGYFPSGALNTFMPILCGW
jgi:hypothetical protein